MRKFAIDLSVAKDIAVGFFAAGTATEDFASWVGEHYGNGLSAQRLRHAWLALVN